MATKKWNWKTDTDSGEKVQGKGLFTRFVGWVNAMLNPDHAWFDYDKMDNSLSSVQNQLTKESLTGEQKAMNQFNADEAQKQREWEQQMSDTAYQRQVADMRAAGINPAMAMGSAQGASTPSGSAATAASGSGSSLSFSDLMQLMMMPLQKKLLASQAQLARDQGKAALMNAGANVQNAGTNEKGLGLKEQEIAVNHMRVNVEQYKAETDRMRYGLEKMRTDKQIELTDAQIGEIAEKAALLKLQREQLPEQLKIAERQVAASEKQAVSSLRQAEAAVQNAATNDRLADSQTSLMYAQELMEWARKDGQDIVNKYLDPRQKAELDNLIKEGIKLDKQGRLIDKQGNLVTAQTVKAYVNCATDVSGAVNQWFNPFSKGAGSSSQPGFDLSGAYQGVAYGYD